MTVESRKLIKKFNLTAFTGQSKFLWFRDNDYENSFALLWHD